MVGGCGLLCFAYFLVYDCVLGFVGNRLPGLAVLSPMGGGRRGRCCYRCTLGAACGFQPGYGSLGEIFDLVLAQANGRMNTSRGIHVSFPH